MRSTRSRLFTVVAAIAAALLLTTACSAEGTPTPTPSPSLSVVATGRDYSVDTRRVGLALLQQQNGQTVRVEDEANRVRFSYRLSESGDFTEATGVTWYSWPVRGGVYLLEPEFTGAGTWEIRAELDEGGTTYSGSTFVSVQEQTSSVAIGEPAPLSETKTGATAEELRQVTSAVEPDPALYSMTVAEAIQSGQPAVITFSTPAFCQTATCGPQLDVVEDLQSRYGDRVHFLHVEVWDNVREMLDTGDPNIGRIAPAVNEWGLITEPWTFLVSADGTVFDKFEAFTTNSQLSQAIDRMLAG